MQPCPLRAERSPVVSSSAVFKSSDAFSLHQSLANGVQFILSGDIVEPLTVTNMETTENSIKVLVEAPPNMTGIEQYVITALPTKGGAEGDPIVQTCVLKTPGDVAGGAICQLNGLSPYTKYVLLVQSCDDPKQICSAVTTVSQQTTTLRRSSLIRSDDSPLPTPILSLFHARVGFTPAASRLQLF